MLLSALLVSSQTCASFGDFNEVQVFQVLFEGGADRVLLQMCDGRAFKVVISIEKKTHDFPFRDIPVNALKSEIT